MFSHCIKKILTAVFITAVIGFSSAAYAALPEHIAVLPIVGDGKPEDLKELRITFFNHIGSKNYRDMELEDIDNKLFLLEQQTQKSWHDFSHQELAATLGVQGLMYLNVVGIEKIFAGVYGSLTVRLEVTFVEASTGRILWQKEEKVIRQSGGVPLSPWAAISTAVSSAMVLRDSVKIELFDKLCRNIAKELPEPTSLAAVRPPTIFSVVTNTLDSPFKANEEILVSLKGDEGLKAYFNIVGQTDAVALSEMSPGLYLGKLVVTEGSDFRGKLMEVFLVNSSTRMVTKYQVPYLVTVDTTPPGEPLELKTSFSEKGFNLSWGKPADDDVKEYVIKKAVVGQSEYQELAVTEVNEYQDSDVEFGSKYFYRVQAKDTADNLSRPAEIDRVVVKQGPTDVQGELKEDTVFYSFGSPYIIRGELTVPKGVRLTIEEGAVVRFEDDASMTVAGSVVSQGTKDKGVSFKGKGYVITLADTGAGGGDFRYTFFRNGGRLEVRNSDAQFTGCRFESFDTAIASTQNANIKIADTVLSYNKTALTADSGGLKIVNAEFLHNSEALILSKDVKAEVEHIITNDNIVDVSADSPLHIEKAEMTGKESFEIIRSLKGDVTIGMIAPFNKSLKDIINDSASDLIEKTGDSLIAENAEESLKYIDLLKELFPDRYSVIAPVEGYLRFKMGDQKTARELIEKSDAPYVGKLAGSLGLAEYSGPAEKVKFVRIKIPVFGTGEGLGKIAQSKAVKQAVKDHVDSVTGRLDRDRSFIVKEKILADTDKYSTGAFPLQTKVDGARFEGFYLVFMQTDQILADLQDHRIIGNRKRDLRIAIASCGDGDIVRPELAKELDTLLFPLSEMPSKGCSFSEYQADIKGNNSDLLLIIRESASVSQSRVSQNLKMISADMQINVFDTKTGTQIMDRSNGLVVYHMNESLGKKAAMKKAFDSVKRDVVDKIVEIERERAPKTVQPVEKAGTAKSVSKPAPVQTAKKESAPAQAKPAPAQSSKGDVVLSVAGVEPVFANMPDAYTNRPFITLVIENTSQENIRKSLITLDIPGYFNAPLEADLESIPASDKVRLQLFAEFGENLIKTDRTKKTDAVITIKYDKKQNQIKYPVVIFDTRTTRWTSGEKLAIFTDDQDEAVKAIAAGIKAETDKVSIAADLKKMYMGLMTADYFASCGLSFKADEKRPFTQVFGSNVKVDTVRFPSETLLSKSGDHDDLMVLFGSVLKALDIDMAFTVSGEKVMTLIDTSIPEELMAKYGFDKSRVVIYDENIWLPFDMTALSGGAKAGWESGAKNAVGLGEDAKVTVLSKSLAKFTPVRLFRQNVKVVPVSTFQAKYAELAGLVKKN
jgi:hypothetical protein